MIRQKFKVWVEDNIESLKNEGISTEFVMANVENIELLAKPFIRIIQESEHCMGQVIVYKSREMDFEVIHKNTEELMLWKYFENIDDDIDFNAALNDYLNTLKKVLNLNKGVILVMGEELFDELF
ncbi:hypothetical protein PASE110613_12470 [Paenibacillus sediminis]|uniref:DUF4085 family protein n=1 Tax=Paenibacillus sediminis TaxID=664909 RepID=A0ABS4H6H0_9BACL|nr:hypothetical protein [Paenibacillus sediminis]MBP1937660.1 hypothetical protein [Paenibacillus sediminis]